MTDNLLRGAAFHEAGHAVVALALGLRVDRVEISHEDYRGRTGVEIADDLPFEDRIAICAGGIQANHMFEAPSHDGAAFKDEVDIQNLIVDFAEGDVLRDKGFQRAWDLLNDHARSVEDIAAQLLAQRKIDLTDTS